MHSTLCRIQAFHSGCKHPCPRAWSMWPWHHTTEVSWRPWHLLILLTKFCLLCSYTSKPAQGWDLRTYLLGQSCIPRKSCLTAPAWPQTTYRSLLTQQAPTWLTTGRNNVGEGDRALDQGQQAAPPAPHAISSYKWLCRSHCRKSSHRDTGTMDREGKGTHASWRFAMVLHIPLNFRFLWFQNSLWFTTLIFRYW